MQSIMDKQIEIKSAVPRDQMPPTPPSRVPPNAPPFFAPAQQQAQQQRGGPFPRGPLAGPFPNPYQQQYRQYPPRGVFNAQGGLQGFSQGGGRGPRHQQFAQNAALGASQLVASFPQQHGGRGGPVAGANVQAGYGGNAGGYDLYAGAGGPNGGANVFSNAGLYNLGNFPQQLQSPTNNKLGNFGNNLNLKALGALASSFTSFPPGQTEAYQDESYGHEADFAANASQLGGLNGGLAPDFNTFHDAGFTSTPAPGWSS